MCLLMELVQGRSSSGKVLGLPSSFPSLASWLVQKLLQWPWKQEVSSETLAFLARWGSHSPVPGGLITRFAGGKRPCAKKRRLAPTRPPRTLPRPQGMPELRLDTNCALQTQFRSNERGRAFFCCGESPPVRIMAHCWCTSFLDGQPHPIPVRKRDFQTPDGEMAKTRVLGLESLKLRC